MAVVCALLNFYRKNQMIPKTLAVKITEKTYPIAVACLPITFAKLNSNTIIDRYYLVVNVHNLFSPPALYGGGKAIRLSNIHLTIKEFTDQFSMMEYKDSNDLEDYEFFEVVSNK